MTNHKFGEGTIEDGLYPGQVYFWTHNPNVRRAEEKNVSENVKVVYQTSNPNAAIPPHSGVDKEVIYGFKHVPSVTIIFSPSPWDPAAVYAAGLFPAAAADGAAPRAIGLREGDPLLTLLKRRLENPDEDPTAPRYSWQFVTLTGKHFEVVSDKPWLPFDANGKLDERRILDACEITTRRG